MKWSLVWLTLAAVSTAPGCGDDDHGFVGVTWKTSRVEYHARRDDPRACEGAIATIEQQSDAFAALLNASPSSWEPIEYFKYLDADDASQGDSCDFAGRACAKGRKVYTTRSVHEHELAHVFFAGLAGDGPPFLEEGFAVGLTCDPSANATSSDAPLSSALDVSTLAGYLAAGRLVSALWLAGSPAQFFALERRLGTTNPSVEQLAQQVQAVYALDVRALWATAIASGPGCIALPQCSAQPLELGETTLQSNCNGRTARLVTPALAPALGLQSAGAPLVLRACTADADPSSLSRLQLGGTFEAPWRTETWFVPPTTDHALFQVEEDQGGAETNLRTRELGAAFSAQCDLSTPTQLVAGTEISIVLPLAAGHYHFPTSTEVPTNLQLSLLGSSPSALEVRWCQSCSAGVATDCESLELSQPKPVTIDAPGLLAVHVKAALTKSTLLRLVPQ